MKKFVLFLTACCLLATAQLTAAPAIPTPIVKTQPNGTEITVRLRGDEKIHWVETLDGYTLMYDTEKYLVYATTDTEGNMIPSTVKYMGGARPARIAGAAGAPAPLQKGLRYSAAQKAALRQLWETTDNAQQPARASAVTGTKKALCVLMQYADVSFTKTQADFDMLINQIGYTAGGAKGSVRDFYRENSYGQLDLVVTVAGPYTASKNHDTYGDGSSATLNARDLAKEALIAANTAGIDLTDFANASNRLETFHVIFAGHGQEASSNINDIWSHKWIMTTPVTLNGVTAYDYSCSPELRGGTGSTAITCIGVICHELCHVFGAPDYYDTDGSVGGSFVGTGDWDIMAGGSWNGPTTAQGSVPAHINMFQKILYGWVTPVELTTARDVTDMPNSAENAVAYIISANANNESYVLENKQKVGFDLYIPGHGLLIYHIHQNAWNGTQGLNDRHPQQVYPVSAAATLAQPNGTPASYGAINSAGCTFPGTYNKRNFHDGTIPMSFSWATTAGINKPINDITESGGKISFAYRKQMPEYTFALNNGDAATSKQTVQLTITSTGGDPAEYRAAETEAELATQAWLPYNAAALTYTFKNNDAGYKTVYTKLRNTQGETDAQYDDIYYKPIVKASDAPAAAPAAAEWTAKIYPNPASRQVTVEIDKPAPAPVSIRIYSIAGEGCLTATTTAAAQSLDLSACPAGLLLVQISDGSRHLLKQIIKL